MSGAGNNVKQLRQGVNEVDDLGDEEKQHGLTKVAKYPDHCKRHSSKVTESVSHKHRGRVPDRRYSKQTFIFCSKTEVVKVQIIISVDCQT